MMTHELEWKLNLNNQCSLLNIKSKLLNVFQMGRKLGCISFCNWKIIRKLVPCIWKPGNEFSWTTSISLIFYYRVNMELIILTMWKPELNNYMTNSAHYKKKTKKDHHPHNGQLGIKRSSLEFDEDKIHHGVVDSMGSELRFSRSVVQVQVSITAWCC